MSRQRQSQSQSKRPGAVRIGGIVFGRRELLDLAAAWLALALAFTFFIGLSGSPGKLTAFGTLAPTFLLSLIAVGTGFLLHELAHKVLAVRFGQVAGFRASYPMLGLAIASGIAGFLFAAPGAVYHRGRVTAREHGLIAVAGPVTNLGLTMLFVPFVLVPGLVGDIGRWGCWSTSFSRCSICCRSAHSTAKPYAPGTARCFGLFLRLPLPSPDLLPFGCLFD